MDPSEARERFLAARVACLATIAPGGRPHVVPIVFAADGDVLYSAVDAKPKSTRALRRLANIESDPRVSVLVDHYSDDWTQLWWARADGESAVVDATDAVLDRLAARYPQYASEQPAGPVIRIEVERWTGWAAAE